MFKQTNKQQILKGLYEENLWVDGKTKSRQSTTQPTSSQAKKNPFHTYFVVAGVMVVTVVVTTWFGSIDQAFGNRAAVVQSHGHDSHGTLAHAIENNGLLDTAALTPSLSYQLPRAKGFNPEAAVKVLSASASGQFFNVKAQADLEAFKLQQDMVTPENYQSLASTDMPLAQLFGLSVRTIVIDPGHGGKDPGAVGKSIYEKDIALEVALRLRDRLLKYSNYRVLMTRETDDTMSLNSRVDFANKSGADLFISIHVNNFPKDQRSFIETYYFGATNDSKILELAARENSDSHYPYAEFKEIIQKIGDTMKFQESKQLAYAVQQNLYNQMHKINKRTSNHGIKAAPFVVLLGLDAPSILTEISCLCNQDEEQRLKSSEYRENIASFLEEGIVTYLNKNIKAGGKKNGEKENLAKAQQ